MNAVDSLRTGRIATFAGWFAEMGPILRAMRRNKAGAVLIALQIAFTMTVAVNTWGVVWQAIQQAGRPSGLAEAELFHIASRGFAPGFNAKTTVIEDLALLRQTPGILQATVVNSMPLSGSGWTTTLQTEPGAEQDARETAVYMVDEHGVETFGVALIAGRDFSPEDVRERGPSVADWPDKAIVSTALAEALWPGVPASEVVGRTFYTNGDSPCAVIGVVQRLAAPWASAAGRGYTMLVPDKLMTETVRYAIRTEPGRLEEMMPAIEEALAAANRTRIVRPPRSMAETRTRSQSDLTGVSAILGTLMTILLIVTALGIVGLAAYSVRRRFRQIGTRRALGARRRDIVRYFLMENFLITTVGVTLGAAATVGFNVWFAHVLEMPKVDWRLVGLGMIALWLLGLLAALGPALRASDVSPAVATRTV